MTHPTIAAGTIVLSLLASALAMPVAIAAQYSAQAPGPIVNRGVVELETEGAAGISVRIAEDIANVVDDGATRRVVPIVGKGALQTLTDLEYLRGVDLAILPTDALDYAKEQGFFPGVESSVTYIAKLYNEEFHLLARSEIKSIADLANQRINVGLRGSGTAITTSRLFNMLGLNVTMTTDSQEVALEKLRKGEIAALAFVAGKPAPLFRDVKESDGFHLLSIPINAAVTAAYVPTRLTAADYPGLVPQDRPVDTVAVGSVLVAADLRMVPERARNVANFVDAFFTGFPSLLEPGHHPKWQEVNLTAEFPGWQRYPAAEQWLQRNARVANTPNPQDLKAMFARFIDERRLATGAAPMTQQDKDALFQQFQQWQGGHAR